MTKRIVFMKPVNSETIDHLIEECQGQTEVEILMDCGAGGDPYSAVAFYNFVKESGIKLTVKVIARCISAGIYILCAAQVRKACPNSVFLIHPNHRTFNESLTLKEIEWQAKSMKLLDATLLKIVATTTQKPAKELKKIYFAESELTANQAYKLGLLTERPL